MKFCRPDIARPSMERHGTSTRNGVGYLVIGAFRGAVILRPAYFLKYFRTFWQISFTFRHNSKGNRKMESLLDALDREVNRKHLAHLL